MEAYQENLNNTITVANNNSDIIINNNKINKLIKGKLHNIKRRKNEKKKIYQKTTTTRTTKTEAVMFMDLRLVFYY